MRDLYKRANFPTIFDIFGEENFIKERRYDEKFDIEILFGRPVDRTMGASRYIFTHELKELILATRDIPIRQFDGVLSSYMVNRCRRLLAANPYKSYKEWLESTDPNKPDKITLPNVSTNPEYTKDYFGRVYIILSAVRTKEGIVFPMGVPKDIYEQNDKKTKSYIFTSTLVDMIKEYRFYPHKGIDRFPFSEQTFTKLKRELGYKEGNNEGLKKWFAAHLELLLPMTNEAFTKTYASTVHISQNSVATVKTSMRRIMQMQKTTDGKKILKLFKQYRKTKDIKYKKVAVRELGVKSKFRDDFRAYEIIKIAQDMNHPMPRELKRLP